jgi:DNA polymerase-3 subunit gamma/tau
MSYEVLARRWRPRTFDEVCGQSHVTTTLRNAMASGKLPHAILLAGPRGIGKTTIARLLARALNCEKGPTPEPCGECAACRAIVAGTSLDVQEIDAASNTGVDNVRDIRDSIRYAAAPGKHRIFIIDEVHMLSTPAFNALLKTLEEPPPNSLFVFATTDAQKIPATVLSRVQRFDLRRLSSAVVLERMREIVKAEGIEIPETTLRALARESEGSLRDAQTLLDRLVSGLGNRIREEDAAAVLDLVDRSILARITDAVLARDAAGALDGARAAFDKGIEPARLVGELLEELRNLVVASLVDDPGELVDATQEEVAELRARARKSDAETLQRLFRVLVARAQELQWSPRPAHSVELAVVRLATLPAVESIASLLERLDALERGGGPGPSGAPPRGPGPAPRGAPAPAGGGGAGPGAASARPPDRQARLRNEVKSHPVVREVIDVLDAELKDVRLREGDA